MNIPVNADGSADVLGVWYTMLEQGKEGSSFKMVEGIRNVHRFIHDSRFYQYLKRGIDVQIILAHEASNDEDKKMLEEIVSTSQLYERQLLFEKDSIRYMHIEAKAAYEKGGLNELVDHFAQRVLIDGKPLDKQRASELAVAFERDYKDSQEKKS